MSNCQKIVEYKLNYWYHSPSNVFDYTIDNGHYGHRIIFANKKSWPYCNFLYGTLEQIERFISNYLLGSPKSFTELPTHGTWEGDMRFAYLIGKTSEDKYNLTIRRYNSDNHTIFQEERCGSKDEVISMLNDYAILFGAEEAFKAMLSEPQPVQQPELITSIKQGDHFKVKGELDVRIDYVVDDGDGMPIALIIINGNKFTTTEKGAIRFLNEVRGNKVNT